METDRNLLFAVLALQADLLDNVRFVEACTLWANQKLTPLPELLVQRGWLTPEDRADVERLLERKLKKHHGDARAGLTAVTTDPIKRSLAGVADADIHQSLGGLETPLAPGRILPATIAYRPESRDRYTLTRLHATGGIGRVWLARDDSLGRDVALKELRADRAAHPSYFARFLMEAQVTGQLEHPGVVPIYEVGKRPEDETPFYTMRFVRGRTLAEAGAAYHERRKLGEAGPLELRELLGALVAVCNAVAYAHSRGVLHRDLKPQNVVLGEYGEVVLLDWGLAKLMDQPELDGPGAAQLPVTAVGDVAATVQGQVLGTPAYMAPEQAEGRIDLLGTATDVYGLGAILYELLTGKPPFTATDEASVMRQVIHNPPVRPRAAVADVPAALEAVCLKALAKNPDERYGTAEELADEIKRWQANEPVSVYRDPVATRFIRWARKHRTLVTLGAALLPTAAVVLAVILVLTGRSKAQVERERQRAEAVNKFLIQDLLAQADPKEHPADEKLTVRALLDKAAGAIEASASMQENPGIEGAVRSTIGSTYYALGLYQRALEELEKADACYDRAPEVAPRDRIFTKNRLCWVIYKLGSFDESMPRRVRDEALEKLGPDHEETVYAADTLATIVMGNGKIGDALPLLRENVATQQRVLGPEHPLTIRAILNLADALISNYAGDLRENLDEAQQIMMSTRETCQRVLGPNHPEALYFESALGYLTARLGNYAEARSVLAPLQGRFLKVFGPDHLDVARWQENFAIAEEGLGHLDAAETVFQQCYAIRKNALGDGHGLTRRAAVYLGRVCLARGKTEEAVRWFRVLLSAGVVRTGKGIAFPQPKGPPRMPDGTLVKFMPGYPKPTPTGGADLNLLGDALFGKGDELTRDALLNELYKTVNWLTWRSDWLDKYIMCRYQEAHWRRDGNGIERSEPAEAREDAVMIIKRQVQLMERNSATPPRLLEDARSCLKRLEAADVGRPRQ